MIYGRGNVASPSSSEFFQIWTLDKLTKINLSIISNIVIIY